MRRRLAFLLTANLVSSEEIVQVPLAWLSYVSDTMRLSRLRPILLRHGFVQASAQLTFSDEEVCLELMGKIHCLDSVLRLALLKPQTSLMELEIRHWFRDALRTTRDPHVVLHTLLEPIFGCLSLAAIGTKASIFDPFLTERAPRTSSLLSDLMCKESTPSEDDVWLPFSEFMALFVRHPKLDEAVGLKSLKNEETHRDLPPGPFPLQDLAGGTLTRPQPVSTLLLNVDVGTGAASSSFHDFFAWWDHGHGYKRLELLARLRKLDNLVDDDVKALIRHMLHIGEKGARIQEEDLSDEILGSDLLPNFSARTPWQTVEGCPRQRAEGRWPSHSAQMGPSFVLRHKLAQALSTGDDPASRDFFFLGLEANPILWKRYVTDSRLWPALQLRQLLTGTLGGVDGMDSGSLDMLTDLFRSKALLLPFAVGKQGLDEELSAISFSISGSACGSMLDANPRLRELLATDADEFLRLATRENLIIREKLNFNHVELFWPRCAEFPNCSVDRAAYVETLYLLDKWRECVLRTSRTSRGTEVPLTRGKDDESVNTASSVSAWEVRRHVVGEKVTFGTEMNPETKNHTAFPRNLDVIRRRMQRTLNLTAMLGTAGGSSDGPLRRRSLVGAVVSRVPRIPLASLLNFVRKYLPDFVRLKPEILKSDAQGADWEVLESTGSEWTFDSVVLETQDLSSVELETQDLSNVTEESVHPLLMYDMPMSSLQLFKKMNASMVEERGYEHCFCSPNSAPLAEINCMWTRRSD